MWYLRTVFKESKCGECSSCANRKTSHQTCKLRKCTELKKKSNYTQNDLKTVDVQPPISRAMDGLNKEIEEIDLEPAKRNLQSNFCNGNIEEQRSDSNPNPSKLIEPEQGNAIENCMVASEQRHNEDIMLKSILMGPSELKNNVPGIRHSMANLPD